MKKSIYKYVIDLQRLDHEDKINISMPTNAKPLYVAEQHGELCVWAEVDIEAKTKSNVMLSVHGTGHEFDHAGKYLGTALLIGGPLVFHVYVL